jgi:hypothetical protein
MRLNAWQRDTSRSARREVPICEPVRIRSTATSSLRKGDGAISERSPQTPSDLCRSTRRRPSATVSTTLAFAPVASAIEGNHLEARAFLLRAEAPLQAEPLERESVLLLASGAVGRSDKVDGLRRFTRRHYPASLWSFNRTEAVVLTMLERWDELEPVLPQLKRVAAKSGSRYMRW